MYQAQSKASNIKLQLAEYTAHKNQVDEYVLDNYEHLLAMDAKTHASLALIQQQPEINLRMRPVLMDVLMDTIHKLNLSKLTFPLTVSIIDRYCLMVIVKKQHYQLLGLTALWIATKNLDLKFRVPLLSDLCKYCCHYYDKKLFLEMERHVLKLFDWVVGAPTFDAFVDVYLHAAARLRFLAGSRSPHRLCNDVKAVAIYICELVQFYPNIYFTYTLPKIAMFAVALACMILQVVSRPQVAQLVDFIHTETRVSVLGPHDFESAFPLLVKVLKCPPHSLKEKYFNENSRHAPLMKQLIAFSTDQLRRAQDQPRQGIHTTPRGQTTPVYPATPVSLTISPRDGEYARDEPCKFGDVAAALPLPNLLPSNDYFGRKQYEDEPAFKRPRVERNGAVFYIL